MAIDDDAAFWSILAYLISGLVFWGGAGALGDHFLGTHFLLISGLLLGLGSSFWLIWLRFLKS
jgi:ATP synthase protein I